MFSRSEEVEFDVENHKYSWQGRPVLGVTEALKEAGIIEISEFCKDQGRLRGTAVHYAIELLENGNLDHDSLHPQIIPYLDAWKRFKKDSDFKIKMQEVKVFSKRLMVAGHADIYGEYCGNPVIADLKTGIPPAWVGPQTAGYSICGSSDGINECGAMRAVIYFNGTKEIETLHCLMKFLSDPSDFDIFRSAVAITNWKRRKK